MVSFKGLLEKFGKNGDKTGWTYIPIPSSIASKIKPGQKKSFRVRGLLDQFPIKGVSILPVGKGGFILPFNATHRKRTGKRMGEIVNVQLEEDTEQIKPDQDFMNCLHDDPEAMAFFKSLTPSHQRYFSKWIFSAKTDTTKAARIARALKSLSRHQGFPEMLRQKDDRV